MNTPLIPVDVAELLAEFQFQPNILGHIALFHIKCGKIVAGHTTSPNGLLNRTALQLMRAIVNHHCENS